VRSPSTNRGTSITAFCGSRRFLVELATEKPVRSAITRSTSREALTVTLSNSDREESRPRQSAALARQVARLSGSTLSASQSRSARQSGASLTERTRTC